MIFVIVSPVRSVCTNEGCHTFSTKRHRFDFLGATITQCDDFVWSQFECDTAVHNNRIKQVEFDESLSSNQGGIHGEINRLGSCSSCNFKAEWINLSITVYVRISCSSQVFCPTAETRCGLFDLNHAIVIGVKKGH